MLCVQDCISGVWREVNGLPKVVAPEACNRCSHCLAVCPKGAIEHDVLDAKQVRRLKKKLLDPDVYNEIVAGRRSVRHYKNKQVPRETIEKILDMARYSPTASNNQNVGYIIIQDKALLQQISKDIFGLGQRVFGATQSSTGKKLSGALKSTPFVNSINRYNDSMGYFIQQAEAGRDLILHNAPVLILLHTPKRTGFTCDNCNIAATNIINYAYALGLGTCFIGFLTLALRFSKALRKKVELPEGRQVYASLIMGYPAYKHIFSASRKKNDVKWIQ